MLPKKTFTMSYILKHAISKQKNNEKSSLSKKKLQIIERSQSSPKLNENIASEQQQDPGFSTTVGDLFLCSEEIALVPFFRFLNQSKRVSCFIWNKALETIDYVLDERNSIESNLDYKGNKKIDCKECGNSQNEINLQQRLTELTDSLLITLKQEHEEKNIADKLKNSCVEELRKKYGKSDHHAFFIEFEIKPNSLKIKKIAFNQKFMTFFHYTKEKDLERVIKCDQLPDCFLFTREKYNEFIDFLLQQEEKEREINVETSNCYEVKFQGVAKFTKKSFLDHEKRKIGIILEGLLEIFDAPDPESNNNFNKKNNLTPCIFKQNWTEFIDRYYIPVKPMVIPKENPLEDRKRCLYKLIE